MPEAALECASGLPSGEVQQELGAPSVSLSPPSGVAGPPGALALLRPPRPNPDLRRRQLAEQQGQQGQCLGRGAPPLARRYDCSRRRSSAPHRAHRLPTPSGRSVCVRIPCVDADLYRDGTSDMASEPPPVRQSAPWDDGEGLAPRPQSAREGRPATNANPATAPNTPDTRVLNTASPTPTNMATPSAASQPKVPTTTMRHR